VRRRTVLIVVRGGKKGHRLSDLSELSTTFRRSGIGWTAYRRKRKSEAKGWGGLVTTVENVQSGTVVGGRGGADYRRIGRSMKFLGTSEKGQST